jgi:DNA primase
MTLTPQEIAERRVKDWLLEKEGYGYRAERLAEDIYASGDSIDWIIPWLVAAYRLADTGEDDIRRRLINCIDQWDSEMEYDAEDRAALADDILHEFNGPPLAAEPVKKTAETIQVEGDGVSWPWKKPEYKAADEARTAWLRDVDANDQMGARAAAVDAAIAALRPDLHTLATETRLMAEKDARIAELMKHVDYSRTRLYDMEDRATAAEVRVAELEAAKWNVRHTDTMNDMVLMGLARDEAEARATAAEARVAELEGECHRRGRKESNTTSYCNERENPQ